MTKPLTYRQISELTPEQMLSRGADPKWGFWGKAHCEGYAEVLKYYIEHPGSRTGPPPKQVFLPVGTRVRVHYDTDEIFGWVRKISDDGWMAWISEADAEYDGTAPWGFWCSWSELDEVQ